MKWHLEFVFRSKVESWWESQSVELWPNGCRTGLWIRERYKSMSNR